MKGKRPDHLYGERRTENGEPLTSHQQRVLRLFRLSIRDIRQLSPSRCNLHPIAPFLFCAIQSLVGRTETLIGADHLPIRSRHADADRDLRFDASACASAMLDGLHHAVLPAYEEHRIGNISTQS